MLKITVLASVALVGLPTAASAYVHHTRHAAHHYNQLHHGTRANAIHGNGYCNGQVDGTGLTHHCGTATGGVPGGMPNRN